MFNRLRQKRKFTLIELIIVIVVIGILAGMAIPKFIGVIRDAKVAAMIRDIEILEKTIAMEQIKKDTLPLYSPEEVENHTLNNNGNSPLEKLVFAEDESSLNTMESMYTSFKSTLDINNDSSEYIYKINLDLLDDKNLNLNYGGSLSEGDFYVYSSYTDNVYYYNFLRNGKDEYNHSKDPISIENNSKVTRDVVVSNSKYGIPNNTIIEVSDTYSFDYKENAIDGDLNTAWGPPSLSGWIKLTFPNGIKTNKILLSVSSSSDGNNDYKIESYINGEWKLLNTKTIYSPPNKVGSPMTMIEIPYDNYDNIMISAYSSFSWLAIREIGIEDK